MEEKLQQNDSSGGGFMGINNFLPNITVVSKESSEGESDKKTKHESLLKSGKIL